MQRMTNGMVGKFDPNNWIEEGDGLLASARAIRAVWTLQRRSIKHSNKSVPPKIKIDWPKLNGMPRSSMLLLAYSTEMYLKSGLAKACRGCSEEFFSYLSQRKYGHRLYELAKAIDLPLADVHKDDFSVLTEMILKTARYPLDPEPGRNYTQLVNARTRSTWDDKSFRRYSNLAKNIRLFVSKLDHDSSNPASYVGYKIDQTGYFASRVGGGLRPRLTFRYSEEMKKAGKSDLETLKALLIENDMRSVLIYWDKYTFIEDTGKPYKR